MKTYRFKPSILSLTVVLMLGIGNVLLAGPNEKNAKETNGEYSFVEDIMNCLQPAKQLDEILIYDQHQQLVIRGSSDNMIIKNYISRSDLLTEVDNVQYYRLSYEEGIETDYRFASK